MSLDPETTRLVQARLFEMGTAIADVLEGEGIPYSLAYGTLLGAVRHRGFIPWDDDFDFWLFEDTYPRAIAALREGLPPTMFVEDEKSEPLYFHSWAHVKDLCSVASCDEYPQDSLYAHKGVSVDLYRVVRMPSEEVASFVNGENRSYIRRRLRSGLMSEKDARIRYERLRDDEVTGRWELGGPVREVLAFTSPYRCKHMETDDVFPLQRCKFEGAYLWGPANPDAILRAIYGDYTRLPPSGERKSHYSSVQFFRSGGDNA